MREDLWKRAVLIGIQQALQHPESPVMSTEQAEALAARVFASIEGFLVTAIEGRVRPE